MQISPSNLQYKSAKVKQPLRTLLQEAKWECHTYDLSGHVMSIGSPKEHFENGSSYCSFCGAKSYLWSDFS